MFYKIKNFQYYTELFWITYALLYIPWLLVGFFIGEYMNAINSISYILIGYWFAQENQRVFTNIKKLFNR